MTSSTMWHCYKANGIWQADKIIAVPSVELEGWPIAVPGLITHSLGRTIETTPRRGCPMEAACRGVLIMSLLQRS